MSTTVTYKGSVLTTVNNQTRVMKTAGKYMEDDVTLVDTPVSPNLESKSISITPSESSQSQTVSPGTGYDGLSSVSITVDPISSTYVGSGITRRDSSDLTALGATVSVPAGYYQNAVSISIANGTEGTPIATKGTVSNHSINITPSVTNTAGYISGGSHSGTPVSVSASELVSGSETKTANGTYDVTNLATLVVNVSGGGALPLLKTKNIGAINTTSNTATDTGKTITLASSTNFTDYDLLVIDISVNTTVNGRHTSTVSMVLLTGTSDVDTKNTYTVVSNKWNSKLSSSGTGSTRQSTTAYGIYVNAATVSSNTMTMTVYRRYNSNNTGTINGTYTARVYGIKLYDLIGG